MINPTVGRVVLFTPSAGDSIAQIEGQKLAAMITGVWSDTCVNLVVFGANGKSHGKTSVPLVQGDMPRPDGYFAEWMPYQKGQAARTEEPESQLAGE